MNKILLIIAISIVVTGIITIPTLTEQFADAGSRKKIHFTQTISSSQDPGKGHENHQLALILSPNEGTLYDGSLTYTASESVQIVVLHEISKNDAGSQPTWTVDGETVYGLSLIDSGKKAGSFEFTGAALALHTPSSTPFTATVSVDGWIRGQPIEIFPQTLEKQEVSQKLSRANVPASIPLHLGIIDGESVYYIITDSSDQEQADLISEKQGWKVELATPLGGTPQEALDEIYVFTNGIEGDGINGFQQEVFSSTPSDNEYSALRSLNHITWKIGQNPELLDSVDSILEAEESGRVKIETTDIILNTPQIIWPQGQMTVRQDPISDDMPYGGGQILEINTDEMYVTFVAHRGWGPDGRTIYYIVTDATPSGPAEMMGVSNSPATANLIAHSAAVDLFQFKNGIKGSGPIGFQAGIAASALGDETYSPMWRIFMIEWNNPENALILETKDDIDAFQSEGLIDVSLARPMNSDHIVNCPFIDPFQ